MPITHDTFKGAGTGGPWGHVPPCSLTRGPGGTFTKVKMKEKRCPYAETSALLESCAPLPLSTALSNKRPTPCAGGVISLGHELLPRADFNFK